MGPGRMLFDVCKQIQRSETIQGCWNDLVFGVAIHLKQ